MIATDRQDVNVDLSRAAVVEATRWVVATLAWLVVMAVGSATVAAASTHGLGNSRVAEPSKANAKVGALFSGGLAGGHFCSASVVDSPGGDLIITAAHCLSRSAAGTVFVPGYRDGTAPYGVWQVAKIVLDDRWTADTDPDRDVAYAVLDPLEGREVQQVVGANKLAPDTTAQEPVTITGYPDGTEAPITCSNMVGQFSDTQLRIACTHFTDGTSGSPWTIPGHAGTHHDENLILGVIGGFEQGGYTPDISYSVHIGADAAALYEQAVTTVR